MSALRIGRPGHPTVLIDLGPGVGRASHARGSIHGGALVVAAPPKKREPAVMTPKRRAQVEAAHAGYKARIARPCGKWMILKRAECARTKGHTSDCMSADTIEAQRLRRRAS